MLLNINTKTRYAEKRRTQMLQSFGLDERALQDILFRSLDRLFPEDELILLMQSRNWQEEPDLMAVDKAGTTIVTLAQDYAFGRDGVKAFKDALKNAKLVHEEYLPTSTTDFTAGAQRLIDKLKDQPGRKIIWILWAGAGNPFKIADMDLKRYGIEIATGGNILPAMASFKNFPGMEGATYYYFGIPKNPVNEALVAAHYKQFKAPPDFFTAGGFSSAMALVTALKATGGDVNTNKLIKTMEGMSFDTPKGKMTFRKEDHQAMQSMYHFKIKVDPAFAWGVPELVREIKPEEMNVPIRNKR